MDHGMDAVAHAAYFMQSHDFTMAIHLSMRIICVSDTPIHKRAIYTHDYVTVQIMQN